MVQDMPPSDPPRVPEEQVLFPHSENSQLCNAKSQPSLSLSLKSEFEPMETTFENNVEEANETPMMMGSNGVTTLSHGFFPAYLSVPYATWPSMSSPYDEVNGGGISHHHRVLKPIPVIPKHPVNVDELVGMSQLSIRERRETEVHDRGPSPLSLKMLGEPSRQSAFHANAGGVSGSDLNSGKNSAIQAV